ncbi:MAG: ATP-binding cassette domain-containing protein, partial [Promethearchaeota archaeon]
MEKKSGIYNQKFEETEIELKLDDDNIIINASNLIKDYEIGDFIVRAVDGVSLKIEEKTLVVIKGPSGAGKTTLLNLIGGLDSPNSGTIYNSGVNI